MWFWHNVPLLSGRDRRSLSDLKNFFKRIITKNDAEIDKKILILGWQNSGKTSFLYIGNGVSKKSLNRVTQIDELADGVCFIERTKDNPSCRATIRYDVGGEYLYQKSLLEYDKFKDVDVILYFFNAEDLEKQKKILGFAPEDYTLGAIRQFVLHFKKDFYLNAPPPKQSEQSAPQSSQQEKEKQKEQGQKQKEQEQRKKHNKLKHFIFVGTHTDRLQNKQKDGSYLKQLLEFDLLEKELQKDIPSISVHFVSGAQRTDGDPLDVYKKEVWHKVINELAER